MNRAVASPHTGTATSGAAFAHAPGTAYNLAVGYLRAFVTLLVVAHHSVLAYHP